MTIAGAPLTNGSTIILNCSAPSLSMVSYRWEERISGVMASGSYMILNVTEMQLKFDPIMFGDEGVYRCIVTEPSGTEYFSNDTTLYSSLTIIIILLFF